MEAEEILLVQSCLAGDRIGIGSFIERFQGDLFAICFHMMHHQQDAEDATQDVLVRIIKNLHQWDQSRPLKPWMLAIAVNRCRTLLSKRSRLPISIENPQDVHRKQSRNEVNSSHNSQCDGDNHQELSEEIQRALQEMREEYRVVFLLFHQDGQSYETIAGIMDRPIGTIKTWLHRTRLEVLDRLRRRGMIDSEDSALNPQAGLSVKESIKKKGLNQRSEKQAPNE